MMQMLEAGGLPLLTDGLRAADADNPRGYFEYEPVKAIARDASWVGFAQRKAVKVVSSLLPHLPGGFEYRVVFMRRPIAAILASQREMLVRRGHPVPDAAADARLADLFARHLADATLAIDRAPSMRAVYIDYPDVISAPRIAAERVVGVPRQRPRCRAYGRGRRPGSASTGVKSADRPRHARRAISG